MLSLSSVAADAPVDRRTGQGVGARGIRVVSLHPQTNDGRNKDLPKWLKTLRDRDRDAPERDRRHREQSHISAEQHSRDRCLALGAEVLEKTRVYLDLKYWIYCRDAQAGRPQKPAHTEIWRILSRLVEDKKVVCPVAYPILVETLKPRSHLTRRQTAVVIDILSRRVAIQPFPVLEGTELAHLFRSYLNGKDAVYPLRRLAWTYAAWLMGQPTLEVPALDDETVNWMRKSIFDTLAQADVSMIVDALSGAPDFAWREYDELHSTLNEGSTQHRLEVTSYDAVFMSEVAGILDGMKPRITEMIAHLFRTATGQRAPSAGSSDAADATRMATNLIYHAYRLKKWTTEFPTIHIGAGLHAAVRHRGQPYKRGDLWDFRHAHSALAYCNAFLTEKTLASLLCHPPLDYDKAYDCRVLWREDDTVEYLCDLESTLG